MSEHAKNFSTLPFLKYPVLFSKFPILLEKEESIAALAESNLFNSVPGVKMAHEPHCGS